MGQATDKVYVPRAGTVPDRMLTALRDASPHAVPRDVLAAASRTSAFAVYLCDMVKKGHIARSPHGLHLPGIKPLPPVAPPPLAVPACKTERAPAPRPAAPIEDLALPAVPPPPEHLRRLIAAIVRRAHGFRLAGAQGEATALVRQAAGAQGLDRMPHVRADLLALADLFAAHRETFPTVDLGRAA